MRRALAVLVFVSLAVSAGAVERNEAQIDREFRKIEHRLNGSDAAIRDACGKLPVAIEDRPLEKGSAVVERVSDVRVTGAGSTSVRPCVRAIARAGIVENWSVTPATDGTSGGFVVSEKLRRARRDPDVAGPRRTEESDRAAAARLTEIWRSRVPSAEAFAAEVLAPDLVEIRDARWNAGSVTIEGTAADERFVDGYRALLATVTTSLHIATQVDYVRPDDAARFALEPPAVPPKGLLRAAYRHAPAGALLRALAELDRRDFVVPSGPPHDGTFGGGWTGIANALAAGMQRVDVHAGAIDVFAPPGTKEPSKVPREGRRVDLDLERVEPAKIGTILGVAGGVTIEAPAGLPPLDVHLRRVPWSQALAAVALASGCAVEAPASDRRVLRCADAPREPMAAGAGTRVTGSSGGGSASGSESGSESETETATETAAQTATATASTPPLERFPASELRVAVLATREDGKRWVAEVETPEHEHVTTRNGTMIGVDGGRALVDAHGVALVLERADAAGQIGVGAILLPF